MHVYMLFGVVMLKPTLRYIEEIVNSVSRITKGRILKILPVSLSVQIGLRTESRGTLRKRSVWPKDLQNPTQRPTQNPPVARRF